MVIRTYIDAWCSVVWPRRIFLAEDVNVVKRALHVPRDEIAKRAAAVASSSEAAAAPVCSRSATGRLSSSTDTAFVGPARPFKVWIGGGAHGERVPTTTPHRPSPATIRHRAYVSTAFGWAHAAGQFLDIGKHNNRIECRNNKRKRKKKISEENKGIKTMLIYTIITM